MSRMLDVLGIAIFAACGFLMGAIELTLIPYYIGSVLFPVTVLLAVVGNVALPWLAHRMVATGLAALVPFATWAVLVLAVVLLPRPEGDVILPGAPLGQELTGFGMLLGGLGAGVITVTTLATPRRPRAPASSAPASPQPVNG
jgi:hypothetical protein